MDVEPEVPLEELRRHEEAVRDGNDRLGIEGEGGVETVRLKDWDPEPEGRLLRRGRTDSAAAPTRPVGTRETEGDLVPSREPLEHVGAERGGRGDREHCYA